MDIAPQLQSLSNENSIRSSNRMGDAQIAHVQVHTFDGYNRNASQSGIQASVLLQYGLSSQYLILLVKVSQKSGSVLKHHLMLTMKMKPKMKTRETPTVRLCSTLPIH